MPFSGPAAAASRKAWRSSSVVVGFSNSSGQVDHRHGRGGHAQGIAVQLASQVGDHQLERLGSTRRGGDDAHGSGARPAQVAVRQVQDLLVVGVGVDGGHEAARDAVFIVHHFDRRCQAIGRAGCIRDHVVLGGVVLLSFTPRTMVRSSPSAGAEMITFLAPPLVMWFSAPLTVLPFLFTPSFLMVKMPVLSTTIDTPRSPHGMFGRVSFLEGLDRFAIDDQPITRRLPPYRRSGRSSNRT